MGGIVAVILLIRVVAYMVSSASGGKGPRAETYVLLFLRGFVLLLASGLWSHGHEIWAMFMGAMWGVPGYTSRLVLVPVGLPYVNNLFQRTAYFSMGEAPALFYELYARQRSGLALTPEKLRPLEKKLRLLMAISGDDDHAIRGPALASQAILCAQTGDIESARALFHSVMSFHASHSCTGSRQMAQGWLLADALARGKNVEVIALSRKGPLSPQRFFFRYLAFARLGESRRALATVARLVLWLLPNPFAARRVLRATGVVRRTTAKAPEAPSFDELCEVAVTVSQGAAVFESHQTLAKVASAWDQAFEAGSVRAAIQELAGNEIEGFEIDAAAEKFRGQLQDLFTVQWSILPPDQGGESVTTSPFIVEAVAMAAEEHIFRIEDLAESLPVDESPEDLDLADRWRSWAMIRYSFERLELIDEPSFRLAFQNTSSKITNHAVWLFNERKAKFLSGEIFTWLHAHTTPNEPLRDLLAENKSAAGR